MATEPDSALERLEAAQPGELKPADALRLLDDVEREAREANKRAETLKSAKSKARVIATQVLEQYELDTARTTLADGSTVQYTPYEFRAYRVADEEAFRAWAEGQIENYYDPTPKLREGTLRDECRRRVDDGEPLPPGVVEYTETRLSRSATK